MRLDGERVDGFEEKPQGDGASINGGFFVLSLKVLDYIKGDASSWEGAPIKEIASKGRLMAFVHNGFWRAMDTLRDKMLLDSLWDSGQASWKVR